MNHADEKVIFEYFSPQYIQHVDGHSLNFSEFIQHRLIKKLFLN